MYKTNLITMLTIVIVPCNLYHKFINQLKQKLNKNHQQLLKLKKIIKSLYSKDSNDYDEISTKLLKVSCP